MDPAMLTASGTEKSAELNPIAIEPESLVNCEIVY
jgi:hypothetical protein